MPESRWVVTLLSLDNEVGWRAVGYRDGEIALSGPEDYYRYVTGTLAHPNVLMAVGYTKTFALWNFERKARERVD